MADSKLSALTALAAAPATDDEIYIRDVSEAAASESKRITIAYLFNNPAIASINAGAADLTIGTTGANKGLIIRSTQDAATGSLLTMEHVSASPANSDVIAQHYFIGRNNNATPETVYYGAFQCLIEDVADGSEDGRYDWYLISGGTSNLAMKLASTGVLSVDLGGSGSAAQVDLFDKYDDALVLRPVINMKPVPVSHLQPLSQTLK